MSKKFTNRLIAKNKQQRARIFNLVRRDSEPYYKGFQDGRSWSQKENERLHFENQRLQETVEALAKRSQYECPPVILQITEPQYTKYVGRAQRDIKECAK